MLSLQEILQHKGDNLVEDLIENQSRKGMRASGYSADNTYAEVEQGESEVFMTVYGPAYWEFQQRGRGPGKSAKPPGALVQAIKNWVAIKGLDIPYYAIAVKINREGTRTFRSGSGSGVITEVINTTDIINDLTPLIAESKRASISARLFL